MTLVGILVVLLCERLLSHVRLWRRWGWYERLLAWLHRVMPWQALWSSAWGGVVFVAGPVIVTAWLQAALEGGVYGLLGFVFGVIVLLFCLGPRDVGEEVHALRHALSLGDRGRVERLMTDLSALPGEGPMPLTASSSSLIGGVLVQAHERLFGVVLWFFAFGPVGAVLYRTVSALPAAAEALGAGESLLAMARLLHALVAWLPTHALALLYGLAGSSDDALREWHAVGGRGGDWKRGVWFGLAAAGCGALRVDDAGPFSLQENLRRALALIDRALLFLLAFLGVLTLVGWLA